MSFADTLQCLVSRGSSLADRGSFLAPLLARLTVGTAFAETGWGKVHNLDAVGEYFAELGIPAPYFNAAFVSYIELVCGALVLVGLATRLAALPLIGTMIVALLTAKASEIGGISELTGTIELTYAVLLTWLAFSGAGTASLDHWIGARAFGVLGLQPRAFGREHSSSCP